MADAYKECPGGTGKKIKFCCPDLVNELDKVQHQLEGGQRHACADKLKQLNEKYPGRACLMALRAECLEETGQEDEAQQALAAFLDKYPENPVALSETALLSAQSGDARQAIQMTLRAIASVGDDVPEKLAHQMLSTVQTLLDGAHIMAARSLLVLQRAIRLDDENAAEMLRQLTQNDQLPLVLKEEMRFPPAPESAAWGAERKAVEHDIDHLDWFAAEVKLSWLAERFPEEPSLGMTLAVLRAFLADEKGAITAFRRVAANDVPLYAAVEAEAYAQQLEFTLMEEESAPGFSELVRQVFSLKDYDAALAALNANSHLMRLHDAARSSMDPSVVSEDGTPLPPPKFAYRLLDAPYRKTVAEAGDSSPPAVLGEVFLYGRETDREARVELRAFRDDLPAAGAKLGESLGEAMGSYERETVVGRVPSPQQALVRALAPPEDASAEQVSAILGDARRRLYLEAWPKAPHPSLNGASVEETARDPAGKIRALAAILNFEMTSIDDDFDFNTLRANLGLPAAEWLNPAGLPAHEATLLTIARWDVAKCDDAQLLEAFRTIDTYRVNRAIQRYSEEMLKRTSLHGQAPRDEIYGQLARRQTEPAKAFEYLDKARAAARETPGRSTAPWDIFELIVRIRSADVAALDPLIARIVEEHGRNEEVMQAVMNILIQSGLVRPQDLMARERAPVPAGGSQLDRAILSGEPAAAPLGLWTPGGAAAPAKKSALWTPGMD